MTLDELQQMIGRRGKLNGGSFPVEVEITQVKFSYGKARVLVCPVAGEKISKWVNLDRITFEHAAK